MNKPKYTLAQVTGFRQQIHLMIKNLVIDMITADQSNSDWAGSRTYYIFTSEDKLETEEFKFIFRKNPVDELLTDKEKVDLKSKNPLPVTQAMTSIHYVPWIINFLKEDFDKSASEIETDKEVKDCADQLLDVIIRGMAKEWYYHNLRGTIHSWNSESNFTAIHDYFNGMIKLYWNEFGYQIDVLGPDPSKEDQLLVMKRDVSFNALPTIPTPNNTNFDICQRYLDNGIITLITLGLVEKNFAWTMS